MLNLLPSPGIPTLCHPSRILTNVDFLQLLVRHLEFEQESADNRAFESSYLSSEQPGVMLNADPILHCLRCLHEVGKGIFGLTLNPRHVEIMAHFQCSFREVMEVSVVREAPKGLMLMLHVPQFIAYTELPLEFTSE